MLDLRHTEIAVVYPVLGPEPLDEEGREREQREPDDVGRRGEQDGRRSPEHAVGEHAAAEDGDVRGADQSGGLFGVFGFRGKGRGARVVVGQVSTFFHPPFFKMKSATTLPLLTTRAALSGLYPSSARR